MSMIDKRIAKRVLAGLTAAASLAAGGIVAGSAMAADTAVTATDADKTIKLVASTDTAFDGKTDTLQAIRLATYDTGVTDGTNLTGVSITTEGAYKQAIIDALKAAGVTDIDNANPATTVMTIAGDTPTTKPAYASKLRGFATALNKQAAITGATGSKGTVNTANKKELDFNGLTPGYYLIKDTTAAGKTAAIPMLVGTTFGGKSFAASKLGVVVYKSIDDDKGNTSQGGDGGNNVTPPDKKMDDNKPSAPHKVGDEVTYTVTQKVPNTTGYPGYRLELTDTLGASLDYTSTVSVTLGGKTLDGKYYKFAQSGNGNRTLNWAFGLDDQYTEGSNTTTVRNILKDDAATLFTPGTEIKVTYKAKINSNVDAANGLKNNIQVDYSNNPNAYGSQLGHISGGPGGNKDTPVEALVGEVVLRSTMSDKVKPLSGVTVSIYDKGGTTPLKFKKVDDTHYVLAAATDANPVTQFKFAGQDIHFKGISGNYTVKQVAPAPGYSTITGANFSFNATAAKDNAGAITRTSTLDNAANANGLAFQVNANTIGFMSIKSLTELPATGSTMTVILGVMSAVVLAGFAVARMKSKQRI